jgi:Domain of unknown function (DUF3387)
MDFASFLAGGQPSTTERGFDPLTESFKFDEPGPFEVVHDWVEIVPTDEVTALEFEGGVSPQLIAVIRPGEKQPLRLTLSSARDERLYSRGNSSGCGLSRPRECGLVVADRLAQLLRQQAISAALRNPTRYELVERIEQLISDYNEGSVNSDEYLRRLIELSKSLTAEEERAVRKGMNEAELAVFDLLTQPDPVLTDEERETVKASARQLPAHLHEKLIGHEGGMFLDRG